jgi:hypothetical protein
MSKQRLGARCTVLTRGLETPFVQLTSVLFTARTYRVRHFVVCGRERNLLRSS